MKLDFKEIKDKTDLDTEVDNDFKNYGPRFTFNELYEIEPEIVKKEVGIIANKFMFNCFIIFFICVSFFCFGFLHGVASGIEMAKNLLIPFNL